jgi:hypothetical protein
LNGGARSQPAPAARVQRANTGSAALGPTAASARAPALAAPHVHPARPPPRRSVRPRLTPSSAAPAPFPLARLPARGPRRKSWPSCSPRSSCCGRCRGPRTTRLGQRLAAGRSGDARPGAPQCVQPRPPISTLERCRATRRLPPAHTRLACDCATFWTRRAAPGSRHRSPAQSRAAHSVPPISGQLPPVPYQ